MSADAGTPDGAPGVWQPQPLAVLPPESKLFVVPLSATAGASGVGVPASSVETGVSVVAGGTSSGGGGGGGGFIPPSIGVTPQVLLPGMHTRCPDEICAPHV